MFLGKSFTKLRNGTRCINGTVTSIQEITELRCAVNQSLKSVVWEIRMLRFVGTGGW